MTQIKRTGEQRRQAIMEQLRTAKQAISATKLAHEYEVSRQIIVGDIALLRASGTMVRATARGYLLEQPAAGYVGLIACVHAPEEAVAELELFVAHGVRVVDVRVDHALYGELVGQLDIGTKQDIALFERTRKKQPAQLLSVLTQGIHLHTVVCENTEHYQEICAALNAAGWLYQEEA